MTESPASKRLIVALDVPTVGEAISAIDALDNVSFFKVGWQLFMTGVVGGEFPKLLDRLASKDVFVDLKVPGDIDNTVGAVVGLCSDLGNVRFLTLSESMPAKAITAAAAVRARKGRKDPRFLTVPFLSSLDQSDLPRFADGAQTLEQHIVRKAQGALAAGCDGVIASGEAIVVCRRSLPPGTLIVSPGIRPTGTSTDDHKRHTTPGEAIRLGADYLVVGRPILQASHPHAAAARVIDEITVALAEVETATK